MSGTDYDLVSAAIKSAIADTPKKSKRVLLKTLLKQYGFKTRQKHWVEAIAQSLSGSGIILSAPLEGLGRDDWVTLSVMDPRLPVEDFTLRIEDAEAATAPATRGWLEAVTRANLNSEKEVEIRFIVPLLEHLGYREEDRSDGCPVEQIVGVRKIRTEADFVLFDGSNRSKDNALLVVEAKKVGKGLNDHIGQARSYAMFLGTPYYLVTNGDELRAFLYRSPIESDVEVFKSERRDLPSSFVSLYNLISREAVIEYKRRRTAVA